MISLFRTSVLVGCLLACRASAEDAPVVRLSQDANVVRVEIGGEPFTEYHFAGTPDDPFVRPYLFPVYVADGVEITSDQKRTAKGDHPHHRSLWVSHGDVNGADHWSLEGKPPRKQRHVRFAQGGGTRSLMNSSGRG
jgi:hypothetical protein